MRRVKLSNTGTGWHTDTLTLTHTRTHNTHIHSKVSGCTFNLPADLGEVSHPLEDFGVRCLVSMRGLQRRGRGDEEEKGQRKRR